MSTSPTITDEGYSTAFGVQRCSTLMRANVLRPAGTQDFDMVNAMTNLVVRL